MSKQVLVFKNNLPNLTVLKIFSQDITVVKPKLEQKIKQAPMMFVGMQLIIDLSPLDSEDKFTLDIKTVLLFLQSVGVRPVAIMTGNSALRTKLAGTGIGVLPVLSAEKPAGQSATQSTKSSANAKKSAKSASNAPSAESKGEKSNAPKVKGVKAGLTDRQGKPVKNAKQASANSEITENEEPRKTYDEPSKVREEEVPDNLIIRQHVRSGQRVYARGDLTIIGTVSQGAEIIADGNIHVYGKLRGRAIAGAHGDEKTAIFCQELDAELVSIAGNYHQLENISDEFRHQSVQILLRNEKICFFSL